LANVTHSVTLDARSQDNQHTLPENSVSTWPSPDTVTDAARVSPSTLRVRRHRERRREGLRLFTVEVPELRIDEAIARGLLSPEYRAEPWPVLQGCYASFLGDKALDWLINGGVITPEQRGDAAAILRMWGRPAGGQEPPT